jgi:kynurenine formamidase
MTKICVVRLVAFSLTTALSACGVAPERDPAFEPSEVIDLGALVTEDLPQRIWGKALLQQMDWKGENSIELLGWSLPVEGGTISGSNAYYTLFNHGGPHVDAPSHIGVGGGIDTYSVESFGGPAVVVDVSSSPPGRSIPKSVFEEKVRAGDVVLLFTGYRPPATDTAMPEVRTLTQEAAEFLATVPVRAIGTDAFSIEAFDDTTSPLIHESFLRRAIPIYEQLQNVDKLLSKSRMFFVGVPVNIKDGDGMIVRPVVYVY